MLCSYHVHSVWSDGKAKIADMFRAAQEAGLTEVGMSDHYVLTPGSNQLDWSMPLDTLDDYVVDVQSSAGEVGEDVIIRLGLEVDYFPETESDLKIILSSQPFDYLIGSVHFANEFAIDASADDWAPLDQAQIDEIIRLYWVRVRQMAESGLFDIAAHLDLTKKYAVYPTIDISREMSEALDAIAKSDMSVELNTAGWYLPCNEGYPDPSIIRGCLDRGIPMLVSSDAHVPENLLRGYRRAYDLLQEVGYTELTAYAGRERRMYSLSEASEELTG